MATVTESNYNPFRDPHRREQALTPSATGNSTSSTPSLHSQNESSSSAPEVQVSNAELSEILREETELPPPYTPQPSSFQGEQSLEFGPHRPFQPAPAVQPHQFLSPSPTGGPGWNPPPSHPSIRRPYSAGTIRSEFATDFYNAGTQFTPPTDPIPSRGYAPPPGVPPSPSGSGSGLQRSQSQRLPNSISDEEGNDGSPTTVPTPGHPLLRDGQILVYPHGHECYKCNNTGYKSFDPSHPCRRCWERYGRPYRGAIQYAPSSSSPSSGNFQRPLPNFKGPPATVSHAWSGYPGGGASSSNQPPMNRSLSVSHVHRPPPGATIVRPGDPRIGGRLCWRCNGTGLISFLIFDEDTCHVCGGCGRTFN